MFKVSYGDYMGGAEEAATEDISNLSKLEQLEMKLENLEDSYHEQCKHIDEIRRNVLTYCEQKNMTVHKFRDDLGIAKKSFTKLMTHSYARTTDAYVWNDAYQAVVRFFAQEKHDKLVAPVKLAIKKEEEKQAARQQKVDAKNARVGSKRKAATDSIAINADVCENTVNAAEL